MIEHYLASAFIRYRRSPFTTAANVLTLALGLACFIAAYGISEWWRGADSHHTEAGHIVVIGQGQTVVGEEASPLNDASNANLAPYLRLDFPELQPVARAMADFDVAVVSGAGKALFNVAAVDPEFIRMFQFDFVAGEPGSALSQPNAVVLTDQAAARLFGDVPALGQHVLLDSHQDAIVTGVIRAPRQPSFMGTGAEARLRFDMLRTWQSRYGEGDRATADSWAGMGPLTFASLPPGVSVEALNRRLSGFVERRISAGQRAAMHFELRALRLNELATHRIDNALFARGGVDLSTRSALIGLGILILLVACVNYANLATAQASTRAREIGLRRTLGARRTQIMLQAWLEALVLAVMAIFVALLVLALAAPAVRARTGIDVLHFTSDGITPLGVLAVLVATVALLAGAYPALVLSGIRPAAVLRPGRSRGGSNSVARLLVGVQFATAGFLLILVAVAHLQRQYLEKATLAPREDQIVILNNLMPLDVDFSTLKARLLQKPQVRSVSVVDRGPWNMNGSNVLTFSRLPEPGASAATAYLKSIGTDYFDALNLPVLAGRAFEEQRDVPASPFSYPADTYGVVIDHAYAERLGFRAPADAVGQLLYPVAGASRVGPPMQSARIIGVSGSEATRLDATSAVGNVYVYFPRAYFGGQHPIVRISRDDVTGGVASITAVWDELAASIPVNIRFFDALFEQGYRAYARANWIFTLLGLSALLIASVGLVGIAVHVVAGRRHEIGVRKTLGASSTRVLGMMLWDFSRPVLIANLVAWPFAFMAARAYLNLFSTRIDLTALPFLAAMGASLLVAWIAVGGQAWRAARVKPAAVLKCE